ncbi:MAG TPA: polysaccharide deacetylase family protein [Thermomicrobiaceae bacterium]|nr:polysaccharide deacetylase family protein [Thermomicrobiaceae bacterium]
MAKQWPEDARCVVLITVDSDATGNEIGRGFDPAGMYSTGGYSPRRGLPRFLEIFARHQIPATVFFGGYDAEHHPDVVRRVVAAGHEVAAHGYLHESWDVSLEEEDQLLRKTHHILTELAGTPPVGWRSPGGQKSAQTLAVLRELGYLYDSSDKDYDGPYPAIVRGEPSTQMVEIPNITSTLDDAYMYGIGMMSTTEILELWKEEFDALYHSTGYFILTCHPRAGKGSGLPARARVLDRLISHIERYPRVHFSRMGGLARWCLDPAHGFMDVEIPMGGRA